MQELSKKCEEANIEENDFTTYTYDELSYELDLVKGSVGAKMGFLENQMVAREMTNLTPIQLEEFESVFRHFDRDGSNTLSEIEFSAALASLGLVYDEDEMHEQFLMTTTSSSSSSILASTLTTPHRTQRVTFEQFIRFMVDVTEDQNTAEQVFQSFREVADGKPYVTELDLRHSLIPDEVVEDLTKSMPEHRGPDLAEDRGLRKWDYISFMEGMMDEDDKSSRTGSSRPGSSRQSQASSGHRRGQGSESSVSRPAARLSLSSRGSETAKGIVNGH